MTKILGQVERIVQRPDQELITRVRVGVMAVQLIEQPGSDLAEYGVVRRRSGGAGPVGGDFEFRQQPVSLDQLPDLGVTQNRTQRLNGSMTGRFGGIGWRVGLPGQRGGRPNRTEFPGLAPGSRLLENAAQCQIFYKGEYVEKCKANAGDPNFERDLQGDLYQTGLELLEAILEVLAEVAGIGKGGGGRVKSGAGKPSVWSVPKGNVQYIKGEVRTGDVHGRLEMRGGTLTGDVYGNVLMYDGAVIKGNVYGNVIQIGRNNNAGRIGPYGANSITGSIHGHLIQARNVSGPIEW